MLLNTDNARRFFPKFTSDVNSVQSSDHSTFSFPVTYITYIENISAFLFFLLVAYHTSHKFNTNCVQHKKKTGK